MHLKNEFSIGEILTAISLFGSAVAFIVGWLLNEKQKREQHAREQLERSEAFEKEYLTRQEIYRKEYSDKIRDSASNIIAKLNRWRDLNLLLFEEIQLIIEETDRILVEEENIERAKSELWKGIVKSRIGAYQKIADEKIEIAYKDLYGYKPDVERSFEIILKRYKYIDRRIFQILLVITQKDFDLIVPPFRRNDLSNKLGISLGLVRFLYECLAEDTTLPFREDIIDLIKSSDEEIYDKQMRTRNFNDLFKSKDGLFWALNGLNHCFLKDYEKALKCFNNAILWVPDRYGYLAGRSLVRRALGKFKEAQSDLEQASTLMPGNPLSK